MNPLPYNSIDNISKSMYDSYIDLVYAKVPAVDQLGNNYKSYRFLDVFRKAVDGCAIIQILEPTDSTKNKLTQYEFK